MPLPPAFDIDRAMADVHWLVEELGPRPHQSKNAQLASLRVEKELKKAGWEPQHVFLKGNIISCRGEGRKLFMAHTDTVSKSPGAVDNAAAVAVLLEMARSSEANDFCLGFPIGEEQGLIGSTQFQQFKGKWHPSPDKLDLVVSLDLTGHGELSVTGLGPMWGNKQLSWLYSQTKPHSEYGYQIVSRILPFRERSDHRPFALNGDLSLQLLGRNTDGIFPNYHLPSDKKVEPESLTELAATIEALATAGPVPQSPKSSRYLDPSLILNGFVIPGWLNWILIGGGLASAASERGRWKLSLMDMSKGFFSVILAALCMLPFTQLNLFSTAMEEETANKIMGMAQTGWWNSAGMAVGFGLILFLTLRKLLRTRGSAALICGIFLIPMVIVDPLLGLPMAIAAILSKFWGPFALLGGIYWFRPSILRELGFHGMLDSSYWGLFLILLLPAFGTGRFQIRFGRKDG